MYDRIISVFLNYHILLCATNLGESLAEDINPASSYWVYFVTYLIKLKYQKYKKSNNNK